MKMNNELGKCTEGNIIYEKEKSVTLLRSEFKSKIIKIRKRKKKKKALCTEFVGKIKMFWKR